MRPTAQSALRDVAIVAGLGVAATVTLMVVAAEDGRLPWSAVAALLAVGAGAICALGAAVRRWGRSQVAELQRGYTTCTFTMGRFWVGASPDGVWTNGYVMWNWDATWVLRSDGEVVSAPSSDGDPPGLYPSPRREGVAELWTGHQWSGYLPRKDV